MSPQVVMRWVMVLALAAAAAACAVQSAQGDPQSKSKPQGQRVTVPVSRVTLYAGGSAYIEHKGDVCDEAGIELRFRSNQVANVLKSIGVRDGGRGAASIQTPDINAGRGGDDRKIDLGANPTQADMLEKLRGAKVRIAAGGETFSATVLTVEKREQTIAKDVNQKDWRLNVLAEDGLRSIPLEKITRIEFHDAEANRQFRRSINAAWKTAEPDIQPIFIRLSGEGQRTAQIAYAMEMQPWKMSYRLSLSDTPSLASWATVANETDLDWKGVRLELRSGLPVALGVDSQFDSGAVSKAARNAGVPAGQSLRRPKPLPSRDAIDEGAELPPRTQNPPTAPPLDPREAFRFSADGVSVARQSAAVVPIGGDAVEVERLSIYNEMLARRNALVGARIRNTGKRYLLQGPVSVVEDSAFVGDGRMENLAPGRDCYLAWSIDLPILVDPEEPIHTIGNAGAKLRGGDLDVGRRHTVTRHYTIENEDMKDRVVIIEHAIRKGWKLVEPKAVEDLSDTVYRFRVSVPAGKQAKFTVREQITDGETIDLATADSQTLAPLAKDDGVDPAVRDRLSKIIDLKNRLADAQRASQRAAAELRRIGSEHSRLRASVAAAGDGVALKDQLRQKLAELEKQLIEVRTAAERAQKDVQQAETALKSAI